jgi:hypothetical protein
VAYIGVDGLTFKLSPSELIAGKPVVLMPSLSVTIGGKGVMAGTITVIFPSITYPGFSPMPGTFNIRGTGSKVLVGGNPVILPGDNATILMSFPGPNGAVKVTDVKCEVDDPNQDAGEYLA